MFIFDIFLSFRFFHRPPYSRAAQKKIIPFGGCRVLSVRDKNKFHQNCKCLTIVNTQELYDTNTDKTNN